MGSVAELYTPAWFEELFNQVSAGRDLRYLADEVELAALAEPDRRVRRLAAMLTLDGSLSIDGASLSITTLEFGNATIHTIRRATLTTAGTLAVAYGSVGIDSAAGSYNGEEIRAIMAGEGSMNTPTPPNRNSTLQRIADISLQLHQMDSAAGQVPQL